MTPSIQYRSPAHFFKGFFQATAAIIGILPQVMTLQSSELPSRRDASANPALAA
jgi:hypothetical protein